MTINALIYTIPDNPKPGKFTMLQLAETALRLSGSKSKIVHPPLPSDAPKQVQPNIDLAKFKFNLEIKVDLEDDLNVTDACLKTVLK